MEHSFIWHGEKSITRAMIPRFGIFKSVGIIVHLDPCNGFFGVPFMQIFIFESELSETGKPLHLSKFTY